jgi:hypothetical protein
LSNQAFAQMGAEKTGPSRHQNSFLRKFFHVVLSYPCY